MVRRTFTISRSRLVLLVLLSFIPVLGMTLYSAAANYNDKKTEATAEALRLVRVIALDQERTIESTRQLLIALAQLPGVQQHDGPECNALFAQLARQYPLYSNLGAADTRGDIFCSAAPLTRSVNIADRPWVQEAMQKHGLSIGQYQVGRITRKAGLNVGYAVVDDSGRVTGVVFAAVDLAWLNQMAARAKLPPGSTLTLIDRNGTILSRFPDGEQWTGKTVADEPITRLALSGLEGEADLPGLDSIPRLHAYTPLQTDPGGALYLIASIPQQYVFREVNRILIRNGASLVLVALVALAAAWGLATVFITRLSESEERLRSLINTMPDTVCFKDEVGRWQEVNDATLRLFDLEGVAYQGKTDAELAELNRRSRATLRSCTQSDRQAWESGGLWRGEEVIPTDAGDRTIDTRKQPLFTADGRRKGLVVLGRDVTEQRRIEKLQSTLYRIAEVASSVEDMPEFYSAIHHIVGELMYAENFYIALYDPATDRVSYPYYVDELDAPPEPERLRNGATARVVRTRAPLLASHPDFSDGSESGKIELIGSRSVDWLGVPLLSEDKVLGVLAVQSYTENVRFGEKEKELLTFVSQHIAWALERKQAQEALRESGERYRTLVENLPVGVYRNTPGPDGKYLMANPAFLAMFGIDSIETLASLNAASLYADPDAWLSFSDELVRCGSLTGVELRLRKADGTLIWGSVTARVVRNETSDEVTCFDGSIEDITERRRVEAAEHEQRMLAEGLRDTAAALASTLDYEEVLDRILIEVRRVLSHDAARILLIEDGEARIARNQGYLADHVDAIKDTFRLNVNAAANLRHMWETGKPVAVPDTESYEAWLRVPEMAWLASNAGAPIRVKGKVIGFVSLDSSQRDFYDQEDAEHLQAFADQAGVAIENARLYEEIHRRAAELEERVAERTAELSQREAALSETAANLQAANDALQAAAVKLTELNQIKSQFVANVSHELRTPLANIKLYLSLLERGKPEKQEKYMATLHHEADLLHHLIQQLLDLTRLELDKSQAAPVPVDVNQLVIALVADRAALAGDHGLALDAHIESPLPEAMIDPNGLRQVLTNLVTNAMNYTPAGGSVVVSTQARPCGHQNGAVSDHGTPCVSLSVTDTGPGIPPNDLTHVFERFYRGEAARANGVPGTGLGLAICREILARYGGEITVDSLPGAGSTFTVWLPVGVERVDDTLTPPAAPASLA